MNILLRRLLQAIPTLLALSFVVFMTLELVPGSAASAVLDDASSTAAESLLCEQLNCDRPVLERYVSYLGGLLRGEGGTSIRNGRAVSDEILLRLPSTLALTAAAIAVAVVIGGTLGSIAATRQGTGVDTAITGVVSVAASLPSFWVALILVSIFALQLGWLPVFGSGSPRHYVMPVLSVAVSLVPGITLLTRSSLLEVRRQMFVVAAHARGLSERRVFWRHVEPVAAIPVISYVGMQAVHLVGSLVAIEIIFNLPGLGGLAVQAALDRDPFLLQGATLTIAVITFGILLVVDVLVMILDPRISSAQP
ncbi:MAG: ABC transporter permease [Anaerolineae bacterium]|nr:ABC transporter permease [Anaerolineae bacterium]